MGGCCCASCNDSVVDDDKWIGVVTPSLTSQFDGTSMFKSPLERIDGEDDPTRSVDASLPFNFVESGQIPFSGFPFDIGGELFPVSMPSHELPLLCKLVRFMKIYTCYHFLKPPNLIALVSCC